MAGEGNHQQQNDGRYAIDIRIFLVLVTLTMAASFIAGVNMVPPDTASNNNGGAAGVGIGGGIINNNMSGGGGGAAKTSSTLPKVPSKEASALLNMSQSDAQNIEADHRPSGQHLLVDIKNVDGDFLNSEERLAKAMVDTVKESGLTLLSYHCHALIPSGVSCVGVLLESHISFHTWPGEGVITLDLFTCGDKPLLPAVETIERLFGIGDNTRSQWSHELRGFRPEDEMKNNYLADSSDLSLWVLSPLEMHSKTQVYSGTTKYQRVDIWDIVEVTDTPSYEDVLKHNMTPGDPRLLTPDYVTPDRLLFLDGTIQSIRSSEKIYHESMVHPAMFAHSDPKHVCVLGGGEGATLREVLKHKTVESAVMIEIDKELVEVSREFLPGFSDCSDFKGRAANCLDDELVSVNYADGRQWFIDRYGESPTVAAPKDLFDVIIVDALDPEDDTLISDLLYSDSNFLTSLVNGMSDDGVLVMQVGTAATIDDPRPDFGIYKNRELLFNMLEANPNVEAMLVYEEPHCGFLEPHSFLVVCKSVDCRSRWYARSDQVDYEIYDRIVRTNSKKRALSFFDGTTQRSYQWPKKGWETVYCRREPTPFECAYRHMDPKAEFRELNLEDEEENSFRVETEGEGDEKISRVFATVEIKEGDFVMADHLASSLMVTSRNMQGLENNVHVGGGRVAVIEDLLEFFEDYSHESAVEGSGQHYVEVGGSVLIRRVENEELANIEPWVPEHPSGKRPKYSPVYERHRNSFDVFMVASRDIAVGEEIIMHDDMW